MWTHKKSGKSYVYPGRTEQRQGTPYYRPYSSISKRFQQEINRAIYTKRDKLRKKENQMYYDMRMIYDNAGRGQKGINAIVKNFKLEIVEILLISGKYKRDCRILEELEDYWRDRASEFGELYSSVGGSAGSHVARIRSPYGKEERYAKVRDLIRHGYSKKEMADYLDLFWNPLYGSNALNNLIDEATGMSYTAANLKYVGSEIINLLDSGIFSLEGLSSYFRGMDNNEMFSFLASKNFPSGVLYLKVLISSAILKLSRESESFYYYDIAAEIGVSRSKDLYISTFMYREMKGLQSIKKDDLIAWLSPYSKLLVPHYKKASDLLRAINWYDEFDPMEIHKRIIALFGVKFRQAKRIYTDGFLTLDL